MDISSYSGRNLEATVQDDGESPVVTLPRATPSQTPYNPSTVSPSVPSEAEGSGLQVELP